MNSIIRYSIFSVFLLFTYCKNTETKNNIESPFSDEKTIHADSPILELLPVEKTGIDFQNTIIEDYDNNVTTNVNAYTGGGVCVADINNDQLPDLYFVATNGTNKMYLNQGNMRFQDITASCGLASEQGFESGAQAADVNGDGWMDFYVCRAGGKNDATRRNQLFINNKNLTFSEMGEASGIADQSATSGATFFDYDKDGDLDLYVLNYPSEQVWTNKIDTKMGKDGQYSPNLTPRDPLDSDRFYRNDNGKFTDVSQSSGIWNLAYGLSLSVSDFNRDGWLDIYVCNDFIQPDMLYINNRKGGFTNEISQFMRHTAQHTMGSDINDFDNDGVADLLTLDMLPCTNARQKSYVATNTQSKQTALSQAGYFPPVIRNVMHRNNGNGTYSDVGNLAGIAATDWSWSGLLFDMDNDGWRDLYVTNGYKRDVTNRDFLDFTLPEIQKSNTQFKNLREAYPNFNDFLQLIPPFPKLRNFCYQNKGTLRFEDMGGKWATMQPSHSFGAAWSDLDADGDLDLVTNNLEQPAFVYENKASGKTGNNYLQIQLKGDAPNTFAIGASALLEYGGQVQYAELFTTRGVFSSVEPLLHFGMGKATSIDKITVRWPNGKTQILTNVPVNQRLTLQQAQANGPAIAHLSPQSTPATTLFKATNQLAFTHFENYHNDFEVWPMNPWKTTELGPFTCTGDINGDGLEDVFIGNGFDHPAMMAVQQPNGTFKASTPDVFEKDKLYEDHGAHFFDADMDGDLDLFVVSGGAEAATPQAWQGRLYINLDGKGGFLRAPNAIPLMKDTGGRVTAHDFDGDGDFDLFVGGRATPGKWPITPASVVLRNDRNRFTDATAEVAPEFGQCGMVTDLQWANLDGDPALELAVCGEWMPVTIFEVEGGKLVNATQRYQLDKTNGLWNRMAVADLDGDGDKDLMTGNLGLNTRFTASKDAPLRCYAADFDKNNVLDPIMALPERGQWFPMVQKEVLLKHIPSLKKKYLKAKDYCMATMPDVYPQSDLDAALNLNCYELATCWWENQGGKFVRHELPVQAQLSICQGIIIYDFTKDGKPDILLAGNKEGFEVETNACDAGIGTLLAGDGKGNFAWVNNNQSGFWARGEVRDLALVRGSNGRGTVVVANNNSAAQVYGF